MTIHISCYTNYPMQPYFVALHRGMPYLMHHHEPITFPLKALLNKHKPAQLECYFSAGNVEITKTD